MYPDIPHGEETPPSLADPIHPGSSEIREPCPRCGGGPVALQKYMCVVSFLVLTRHSTFDRILCRDCSTREALRNLGKSTLLGWWGIPWGLMTIRAIWLNTKVLLRWSTFAPVNAVVLGLLALSPPALLVWAIFPLEGPPPAGVSSPPAGHTDEMAPKSIVEDMQRGFVKQRQGDPAGALESFQSAYRIAPGSSLVNAAVASALHMLRRDDEALSFAARAEALDPGSVITVAIHGMILAATGDTAEVESRVVKLRGIEPADPFEAMALTRFFSEAGKPEDLLRAAEAGLRSAPDNGEYETAKLDALLALGRIDQAAESLNRIQPDIQATRYVRYLRALLELHGDTAAGMDRLLGVWGERSLSDAAMLRVIATIRETGRYDAAKRRVTDWLHAASTPPDAWACARSWFSSEEWAENLDRYLSRRMEVEPALQRIDTLDPVIDTDRVLALAGAVRDRPHLGAVVAERWYVTALSYKLPPGEFEDWLKAHVSDKPSHVWCELNLARSLLEGDPRRALPYLDQAAKAARDDPWLAGAVQLVRLERDLAEGRAEEALEGLEEFEAWRGKLVADSVEIDLMKADAAFHAGKVRSLDRVLRSIGAAERPDVEGPAMLLRWSEQLARGKVPTYSQDVAYFRGRYGDELRKAVSASVQAILQAEGAPGSSWSRRIFGGRGVETAALVAIFKRDSRNKQADLSGLRSVAASPRKGAYATRLARSILARRGEPEGPPGSPRPD